MQDSKRQHGFGLFHVLIILIVSLGTVLGVNAYLKSSSKKSTVGGNNSSHPPYVAENQVAPDKKAEIPPPIPDQKSAEGEKIQRFQKSLIAVMKDPDSAQFRNTRIVQGKGGDALCGEVNGKNSFGGYIGYQPFAVTEIKIEGAQGNVILYNENDDFLIKKVTSLLLGDAGCGTPNVPRPF